jgi:hypothetical protein
MNNLGSVQEHGSQGLREESKEMADRTMISIISSGKLII